MGNINNKLTLKKYTNEASKSDIVLSYEDDAYNEFYDRISVIFRILSYLLFASFLLYIVLSAFNNAADFSYENFEYIIRNFALTLEETRDDSTYAIRYNPDASRSYSLFGNGLIVCGSSGVSSYSSTGRLTCSESHSYKDPQMVSSNKFVLVYDQSGGDYSLYNSFSKIYSDNIDGVIRGAAVSDIGYYALITSSEEYNTTVELYDDTFSLIYRFNKVGYVIDIDLTNSNLMIATAVVSAENVFDTEIQVFDYLVEEQTCSFSLEDNFPISCVIESSCLTVIGNKYTAFYNINGDYISRYAYDIPPVDFSVNKGSIQLLFKEEGFDIEYRSVTLNEDGGLKYEWTISSTVFDAEVYGNWTYCLIEGYLLATDGEHFYEIYVEGVNGNSKLLSFDEGIVYVCTDNASPLYFIP